MALGTISPVAVQQFMDGNGDPLAGGSLGFFLAGTTTPSPAYADVNLTVPLANPVVLDAAGRAPELFLGALTYKQVLKNALGTTIWTADNIITPAALRSVGTSTSVTGIQHDFAVPQGLISFVDFRNTAPVTIDGFSGGTPGQLLLIRALGSANVNLIHASASVSALGNQMYNFVASGPTTLVPISGTATYIYQEGSWILLNHEQGSWIRVPFLASNFFTPTGTWVVQAGDVVQMDYRLSGTSLTMSFFIGPTDITGAPAQLYMTGWPYKWRTDIGNMPGVTSNSNAGQPLWGTMLIGGTAGGSVTSLNQVTFGPWAANSNVYVNAQVIADVL